MKKHLLLCVACVMAAFVAKGQSYQSSDSYPHVVVMGVYKCHPSCRDTMERRAGAGAMTIFDRTHVEGFKMSHPPLVIITSHDNRLSLAVGGHVSLRAGYDFEG
ncbi:MAG: hypothetical protein J6R31_06120, partial [Rikenellaceae bacterium]|nr:hypothetical protein [Rikenellaceae bacterium]